MFNYVIFVNDVMRIIADLQIHSKYSRACSQELNPKNIGAGAGKKGINIIGTGDFTHPKWLAELKESLEETNMNLPKGVSFIVIRNVETGQVVAREKLYNGF